MLVHYGVTANISILIPDGKVPEHLRLLQYLPIQLPHPEILLPLKVLGVF